MRAVTVVPKRSKIIAARFPEVKEVAFTFNVPETDAELLEIVGNEPDGTPRLTFQSLAMDAIANRIQVVLTRTLSEDLYDDNGVQIGGAMDLAEVDALIPAATQEAYRLLCGDRATRQRESKEQVEARVRAEAEAKEIAGYLDAAQRMPEARATLAMLAESRGFAEAAAKIRAM